MIYVSVFLLLKLICDSLLIFVVFIKVPGSGIVIELNFFLNLGTENIMTLSDQDLVICTEEGVCQSLCWKNYVRIYQES